MTWSADRPVFVQSIEELEKSRDLVCLNLGGKRFYALVRNFAKLPGTRLTQMVSHNSS